MVSTPGKGKTFAIEVIVKQNTDSFLIVSSKFAITKTSIGETSFSPSNTLLQRLATEGAKSLPISQIKENFMSSSKRLTI